MTITENMRGILAILAASTGFAVNDALVKIVTVELPNSQIIVLRGAMATLIIAVATTVAGAWRPPGVLLQMPMLIRLITSAFATICIVAALRHLPLATTSAILQVGPLAVTAAAALLLGAPVGWRRWLASIAGFIGVLFVIKPGTASFVPEAWIGITAMLFTATRDLTTRFIDHAVPSLYVAVASSAIISLGGLALMPFDSTWVVPSMKSWALLTCSAASLYVAYYFGIVAMRTGEIAVVSPFRYALILEAMLLGYLFWGYVPDAWSVFGTGIVVVAGIYLLHREHVGAKVSAAAKSAGQPPPPSIEKLKSAS